MDRLITIVILGLLISTNLDADEETPSIELIEFLADWEQEDDVWSDTNTFTPTATTDQEVDDESDK